MTAATALARPAGPLAPFRNRAFAILWIATVVSNIGTWMHDVGAGWLMTELSPSPVMVAAVQAATTLPVFVFALLAGAVADIVNRRRLLIFVNVAMGAVASAMTAVVAAGLMTPWLLLAFTVLLGQARPSWPPAWQAIVPALVARSDLPAAIALNSTGINISRAIGPAVAGALIVGVGLAAPFAVNALSVLGIVAALIWWRPEANAGSELPSEQVAGAIRAGLQFAWNSSALGATLIRAVAFFSCAGAFWALLPLVARVSLGGGAALFGVLMGAVGVGAVCGALGLATIRSRLGLDRTVVAGSIGIAASMALLALAPGAAISVAAALLAGASWIAVLSTLNVAAQSALSDWVRARGLSILLTVFFGSMTIGSLAWGKVASIWGVPAALAAAAIGIVALIPLARRARLGEATGPDLGPSMHWPALVLASGSAPDSPEMIEVEYRVAEANQAQFRTLVSELGRARRRNGGFRWSLMRAANDAERFVETWFEASWLDHQRHHRRVRNLERDLQDAIEALQVGERVPMVSHFTAPGRLRRPATD